ncbi:MAG: hypothetical protein RPT11_02920 [Bermanella sp.]
MAVKKPTKNIALKVVRGFMYASVMVPVTQGKDGKEVVVEAPLALGRELIANGKCVEVALKKNYELPKASASLEDELDGQ